MRNQFLIMALLISLFSSAAPPIEEGKALFMTRCASCHQVNKILTGPALAGVDERRSIDWIVNFVHSSKKMIEQGDKDAVAVYMQFNRVPMPDHPDLTNDNIKSIVDYIKTAVAPADKDPFARPGQLKKAYQPLSLKKDYLLFIGYLGAVGLLIGMLLMAVRMARYRNDHNQESSL